MRLTTAVLISVLSFWAASAASATKYPGLNYVLPLSVKRGETTTVTVDTNGDVKTAYKALIQGEGVTAKILPRDKKQKTGVVKVELAVAADATLGPREMRIATKEAITTAGRFYITDNKVTSEADKNDAREQAQEISLPVAVNGRVEKTLDLDWYKFAAKKDQIVTFSVLGVRMHDTIHKIGRFINHFDSMLTLSDENGVELALNDDHYKADPLLSYRIPRDGTYYLCLREATYKGNAFYTYTLTGVTSPWPTHSLPLAVNPGKKTSVRLFGPGYQGDALATVSLAESPHDVFLQLVRPESDTGFEPELPLLASDLPITREEGAHNERDKAQPLSLPAGVAGLIGTTGEADFYQFAAKKGETYEIEVFSRRLYTALDSELSLYDAKGKRIAVNDDSKNFINQRFKDSRLEWKAPADGDYTLAVRDIMGRGGLDYAYHLSVRAAEPDFQATCNPDLAMIGPGTRTPIYVKLYRFNGFDEPVKLTVRGLPEGVTASELTIPSGVDETVVVLEAAKDAKITAANFTLHAETQLPRGDKKEKVTRQVIPLAEIYQAGYRIPVHTMAAAVTEPSDVSVDSPVTEVVLKPGESKEIPVTIKRADKYKDGRVTLVIDLDRFGRSLPRTVKVDTRKSDLVLSGKKTTGKVVLTADAKAKPLQKQPMVVIGQVSIEFSVYVPYCTAPIAVTVAEGREG